jgi:RNA recognition motif-containing protein
LTAIGAASQLQKTTVRKLLGVPRHAGCMWVRNNKGNVFVGNLPPEFSDERLAEAFDPFGIVLSAIVARDPATGARLRYGFVDIATERAANKAIESLHGSEVDGCKLNVKPRDKAPKKAAGGAGGRRPSPRTVRPNGDAPGLGNEFLHRIPSAAAEPARRPSQSELAESRRPAEDLPPIEPPPRRDFEIVRRPIRRTNGPKTFQVERRPLPRRV